MKVLCFGDNTSSEAIADRLARQFASSKNLPFRGLYSKESKELLDGCYHSSIYELSTHHFIENRKKFDKYIFLDQDQEQYSHTALFQQMFNLINAFEEANIDFEVLNDKNFEIIKYWTNLLTTNRSFCLRPWITYVSYNGYRRSCERGGSALKPLIKGTDKIDWQNNEAFNNLRSRMLKGLPNKKNCEWCIKHEKFGSHLTTRWHDTIAWALKLKLKNIEDLKTIKNPTYYEIRPGNKCNVMCRSCTPGFSSLIEEEYKNIDHPYFKDFYERQRRGYDSFDVVDLDTAKTIYVTGGEPTINAEFYAFLRKCIKENKTNFNLRINSNFMKISNPIRELFKYFDDIGFTVSIDGTPKITEYVRWKTVQEQVEKNVYLLKNDGHRIACTSVISIYNVTTIGETLEYLETKFPFFTVQLNYGGHRGDILNCFNHPNKDMVIASLEKARKSKIYYDNERDTKSLLDSLYKHYTSDYKVDYDKLKKFFEYNDILDKSRGSKLGDYIPELEACRKLINT